MYKFDRKGGQWLPHCNTGLHVVNFIQNQESDQAAAAAAGATSTTSSPPTTHTPTPPKSHPPRSPLPSHHSPVIISSPRRVQHRVLNGHTVAQRDTSSIHPTPSRIRPGLLPLLYYYPPPVITIHAVTHSSTTNPSL